ncbi:MULTISPECIES: hypothetical protein [Nocardia]|uniref:hypothetical protein n=1 Tax=Nocardia TaxID=1817 RepID=UPI00189504BA|nr:MULTISPECIES: hypothetical protein [Nocardia]MBF6350903.1 hypothetical protein [Nocardia flavorosea]
MNGMTNYGIVTVIPNTRLSAASRGFLALQGTGPSCIDRFGAQPRMRDSHQPNFIDQQDQSDATWLPAAAFAAAGSLAIDLAAAPAVADKQEESLRKGHHATVNRRPDRRPG